jgi:predicted PurR-regulated permease PerM
MHRTPAFLANVLVMFILLYFLLASGDQFLRKLVRIAPRFEDKRRAVEIAHDIEQRISVYLQTITLINLGLGISVAIAAYFVGLPNAPLWGFLAFALNFIPYLGALIGIAISFVISLLTFDSLGHALVLPAIYLGYNIIEGNFVTPYILSRILTLNTVIVFFSIMFWTWLWGIPGALLAVPILATFKIVSDHVDFLRPVGDFIGDEPQTDKPSIPVEKPSATDL